MNNLQAPEFPRPLPILILSKTLSTLELYFDAWKQRNIFGILLDPMTASTGLGVDDFSLAIGIQAVIWGLTTPITASLAERYGTARMIALGGTLYATGLALMSLVQTPTHMNLTAGMMLGLGLSATGFPIILAAITKRVDAKRRSLFLGIGSAAGSSGQRATPERSTPDLIDDPSIRLMAPSCDW